MERQHFAVDWRQRCLFRASSPKDERTKEQNANWMNKCCVVAAPCKLQLLIVPTYWNIIVATKVGAEMAWGLRRWIAPRE